jgi:hypothetical protein
MTTQSYGDINQEGLRFVYSGDRKTKGRWVTEEEFVVHREKRDAYQKHYYETHSSKEARREYMRQWRLKNRPPGTRKYTRHANAGARKKYTMNQEKARYKEDSLFATARRLRSRTGAAFKAMGYHKQTKTAALLGADWPTVRDHIEAKFTDGMSWDNRSEWHVDHITPLASAGSIEELEKLCHYTNLQPLWATDNLQKGARY